MKRLVLAFFLTSFLAFGFLFNPFSSRSAHAAPLSVTQQQDIQQQSVKLYERLHHQKRSQAEIDTVLFQQFGLQHINTVSGPTPRNTTNRNISLPTTTVYLSRGTVFLYSDFGWTCVPIVCGGSPDGFDYNDTFGVWFSQNVNVTATSLSVTTWGNNQLFYPNPTNFSQAGADYSQMANSWSTGVLGTSWRGTFPSGCTEIFTKYTHGWKSSSVSSVQMSAGFPPSFGISVTYSSSDNTWQATGPTPAHRGC